MCLPLATLVTTQSDWNISYSGLVLPVVVITRLIVRSRYVLGNWVHYSDVIMSAMASQITSVTIIYTIVCSGADRRKHQSSAALAFVRGIQRSAVNSPHKGPVTRKRFPFDDVVMSIIIVSLWNLTSVSATLLNLNRGLALWRGRLTWS